MIPETILLADDEDTLRENLAQVLREERFDVISCRDGTQALKALQNNSIDAIITDLRMPGIPGMELIDHARELSSDAPIIVMTAFGEVNTAVEAMKKGAQDYICKPIIFDELVFKLKQLLARQNLALENRLLREQISQAHDPTGIVSKSPSMRGLLDTIERVSHTMSNVLLLGESGTGKDALTKTLHYGGVTKDKALVAVNCGGLTETLIESALFGYRKGAFTGAHEDRIGYFEAANGGTLLLDEIGAMPIASQAVLLRAIENKVITRVGDTRPRRVDLRIVAATNTDLETAIEEGRFREDLYYRLNIIRLVLPPLRDRTEDIPLLVEHFLAKYNVELKSECPGFSEAAMAALCAHTWPGNVRELENIVERALIFANDRPAELADLPVAISTRPRERATPQDLRMAMRECERKFIIETLSRHNNNKIEAAAALGIGLSSLYRKMDEMQIGRPASANPDAEPGT